MSLKLHRLAGPSLLLLLAACRAPEPDSSTGAVPVETASLATDGQPQFGPHHSPILVSLSGPEKPAAGQDITLVAQIDQAMGQGLDVSLELQLPPGTRLVSGKASELLSAGSGRLERRFVVHLDDLPERDIELVASTKQRSFGARAKGVYRFGRPEPRLPDLKRAAQPLYVSGRNVGRPIELR